jgi:hypothetical protein
VGRDHPLGGGGEALEPISFGVPSRETPLTSDGGRWRRYPNDLGLCTDVVDEARIERIPCPAALRLGARDDDRLPPEFGEVLAELRRPLGSGAPVGGK